MDQRRAPACSWSRTSRRSARASCDVLAFHGYAPERRRGRRRRPARGRCAARFALVVLDVMLPGTQRLRRLPGAARARARGCPILMLTARGAEEDVLRGLPRGRRRLRDEALLGRGAGGARRGAAAPRRAGSPRDAARAVRVRRPGRSTRRARAPSATATRSRAVAPRGRAARAASRASAGASSAAGACCGRSGASRRRSGSRRAPSTCTSRSCARSSARRRDR